MILRTFLLREQAYKDFPEVSTFLYVDSDSAVSAAHANTSLLELTQNMAFLTEDRNYILVNQDGPGSWCQDHRMKLRPDLPPLKHCTRRLNCVPLLLLLLLPLLLATLVVLCCF